MILFPIARTPSNKSTVVYILRKTFCLQDLHRTGWSGLDGDKERVLLRRVLLAYARYNKTIGYCQGFNVIAALILEVTEYKEEQALKVSHISL